MPTTSSSLRGILRSARCSPSHPSISLSFQDGSVWQIHVDGYTSATASSATWSLVQTPGADPAIERLFSPPKTQDSALPPPQDEAWQVIDCTFITMSDKAFRYNAETGEELRWDENHKALALKLQMLPSADAMAIDEPPSAGGKGHKPRWHCIWATKEVYTEEISSSSSGTGFRQCIERSYNDVYLHPNPGNPKPPPPSPKPEPTPSPHASWRKRRGSYWDSRDSLLLPPSPDTQMLAPDTTRTTRNSKRSRTRSRSPMKSGSNTSPPRHQNGSGWNQGAGSSPARPIPMTRRGSNAEGPFSHHLGSFTNGRAHSPTPNWITSNGRAHSPTPNWATSNGRAHSPSRPNWAATASSRPSSPSKLRVDIPWTPSRRGSVPVSPSKNPSSSSSSTFDTPSRYNRAGSNWHGPPASPTKGSGNMHNRMMGQAYPHSLAIPPQPSFVGPRSLAARSPSKDENMFGSDAGSDLSTPSLTHSSSSQMGGSNEWLIVENGLVRTTMILADD